MSNPNNNNNKNIGFFVCTFSLIKELFESIYEITKIIFNKSLWSILESSFIFIVVPILVLFLIANLPMLATYLWFILWFFLGFFLIINIAKQITFPEWLNNLISGGRNLLPQGLITFIDNFLTSFKNLFQQLYRVPSILYTRLCEFYENLSIEIQEKFPIASLFLNRNNQQNNQYQNILNDIFILRVPLIGGLILVYFPLVSQFIAPRLLQNLFVIESGWKLLIVTVLTFLTAFTIASVIKNLTIPEIDRPCIISSSDLPAQISWTIFLSFPNFLILGLNNLFLDKEPFIDVGNLMFFLLGLIINYILFNCFYYLQNRSLSSSQNSSDTLIVEISVGIVVYFIAIYFNSPKPDGSTIISPHWQAPTLLYALLIIWIITQLLGFIVYHLDQYSTQKRNSTSSNYYFYLPILLLLILFSAFGYGAFKVDHYFELKDSNLSSKEVKTMASDYQKNFRDVIAKRLEKQDSQEKKLVVVAASGGGIQASGWTAEVLARLENKIGPEFTQAIGLISSTSGGSVGTMFYLDKLNSKGFLSDPQAMIKNATDDWLDSVGWGLAYSDLVRVIGFPFLILKHNKFIDRGYALEKDWQRQLNSSSLTLDDWYKRAKEGEIPIPVFNSTLVENGRRFLISPMKFIPGSINNYLGDFTDIENQEIEQIEKTKKIKEIQQTIALDFRTLYNCGEPNNFEICNLDIMSAARLSATFPYVSPMARNDRDNEIEIVTKDKDGNTERKTVIQNYHMADGGFFDNPGAFTAIEWLNNYLTYKDEKTNIKKVIFLQINASSKQILKPTQQGNAGFLTVLLGPLQTLNGVRDSTQVDRNIQAEELLKARWKSEDIDIQRFDISFPAKDSDGKEYDQPLSWRLTKQQKQNLTKAWDTDKTIIETVKCIEKFWNSNSTVNDSSDPC